MTFADSLRFLFSLGPELKTVKWDLERIQLLLEAVGSPHRQGRFIHVAGTNGKGSTCAMMASALQVSGFRTGLYTSPHLNDPRERIQLDGEPVSEQLWTEAFEQVHAAAESLLARDVIDGPPSFFETITAMAFLVFAREKVDVVVLETGLGGRLDATNVVLPELSVITQIDFDHEAFLGSSIELIAAEKAGIIKQGRPVVLSAQRPEAFSVLERRALEKDAPVTLSSSLRVEQAVPGRTGSDFLLVGDEVISIHCPLPGLHQIENARTAAVALRVFGLDAASISAGIARAVWPGRLERVGNSFILDGAHNPAGAKALASYIRQFYSTEPNREPIRLIYGAMRDKAIDEVTGTLFPLAAEIILTAPDQARALNPESIREINDYPNTLVIPRVADALAEARSRPMTTFVTGSLFLVGEARAILRGL